MYYDVGGPAAFAQREVDRGERTLAGRHFAVGRCSANPARVAFRRSAFTKETGVVALKTKQRKTKQPRPTIKASELQRLSFCNSKNLPSIVLQDGKFIMWVGFGWIPLDNHKTDGTEPKVVAD